MGRIIRWMQYLAFTARALLRIPAILGNRYRLRDIAFLTDTLGVDAVPLALFTGAVTGLLVAMQVAASLKALGTPTLLPSVVAVGVVRELGPAMGAVVVGGRAAAGISSEIATLMVTGQVDAMRTFRREPLTVLVATRLVAMVLAMGPTILVASAAGLLGGYFHAATSLKLSANFYFTQALNALTLWDVVPSLTLKPLVFGLLVSSLSCHAGYCAKGGTDAVGRATIRAVVGSLVGIVITDFILGRLVLTLRPPPTLL